MRDFLVNLWHSWGDVFLPAFVLLVALGVSYSYFMTRPRQ